MAEREQPPADDHSSSSASSSAAALGPTAVEEGAEVVIPNAGAAKGESRGWGEMSAEKRGRVAEGAALLFSTLLIHPSADTSDCTGKSEGAA